MTHRVTNGQTRTLVRCLALAGCVLLTAGPAVQILLLDEATNAIDAGTEAEVLRNIRKARPDLTIVVIAHRGAALATAGHAVLLHDGAVADAGLPGVPTALGAGQWSPGW